MPNAVAAKDEALMVSLWRKGVTDFEEL